jgi:hypothetical protein
MLIPTDRGGGAAAEACVEAAGAGTERRVDEPAA